MQVWLWPDRTIGKIQAGSLRDEHNVTVSLCAELLDALENLESFISEHEDWWFDDCLEDSTEERILESARVAIRKAKS